MRDRDATMPKIDCAIVLRHIDLEGTVLRYSRFQCSVAMWIAPGALDPTTQASLRSPRTWGGHALQVVPRKRERMTPAGPPLSAISAAGTIVDMHGGTISAGSPPRGGAALRLALARRNGSDALVSRRAHR